MHHHHHAPVVRLPSLASPAHGGFRFSHHLQQSLQRLHPRLHLASHLRPDAPGLRHVLHMIVHHHSPRLFAKPHTSSARVHHHVALHRRPCLPLHSHGGTLVARERVVTVPPSCSVLDDEARGSAAGDDVEGHGGFGLTPHIHPREPVVHDHVPPEIATTVACNDNAPPLSVLNGVPLDSGVRVVEDCQIRATVSLDCVAAEGGKGVAADEDAASGGAAHRVVRQRASG
mmetsp:Transcript_18877/g.38428  ORF Transcript_18877/g.38428 Transcript_18877/m.38428 type:complete len:229 (-) Transcript_18877:1661-2347(-)